MLGVTIGQRAPGYFQKNHLANDCFLLFHVPSGWQTPHKKRHQSNQRAFHLHNSMASSGCNWIAADPQGGNLTLGAHVLLLPAPAIVGTSAPVIGSISTRSRDTQRAKQGQWIEQAECRSGKPNPAALLATRDASQKGSDLSLLLGSPAVRLNRISRAS